MLSTFAFDNDLDHYYGHAGREGKNIMTSDSSDKLCQQLEI